MRISIQAVPERTQYIQNHIIPELQKQGNYQIKIFTDYEKRGPLWNALRIWNDIKDDSEPSLILQDDIVIHSELSTFLPDLTAHVQTDDCLGISLFAPPRKIMRKSFDQGKNMIKNFKFLWLQAIILNPKYIRELTYFAGNYELRHDDLVLQRFSQRQKIAIWNILPSLVQHNLNIKSIMGHPQKVGKITRQTELWIDTLPANHFMKVIF